MNRQQLLDIENPTHEQAATQMLLMSTSMTRLEEIRRVLNDIDKKLYKTALKNLPFSTIANAVDVAAKLSKDETIEEKPLTAVKSKTA